MLKNIKLRGKILLMLLFISFVTAGVVGTIAFTLGTKTMKEESYRKLTAIREMKANQVENYFQQIFDQVASFSESRTVIEATLDLKQGFDNLKNDLSYSPEEVYSIDSVLKEYYQTQFLDQLFYRDSSINYFSIPKDELYAGQERWLKTTGFDSSSKNLGSSFPRSTPSDFSGTVDMSGSSTIAGLVNHIIKLFKEQGARGSFNYESTGTSKGIINLIHNSGTDIVGSSRRLNQDENKMFSEAGIKPVSFRVGTDALVVTVSDENDFLTNLSLNQIKQAFLTANKWSDINPEWPDELIRRFIPAEGSGSYNLFSDIVFDGDRKVLLGAANTNIIQDGKTMTEVMHDDPYTIAMFSYNYFDRSSQLRKLNIDNIVLDNGSIRNKTYPFTRPLYLITSKDNLAGNTNVSILINYFLNSVDEEVGTNLSEVDYWPQHINHRILQYQYIVDNPFPKGEKDKLVSSPEKSAYNSAHLLYHNLFKNYLDRFGYYDIFLIDADSGHIIYSVSKEVDFATDILHGPYQNTNIAEVFRNAAASDDPGTVCFEDFEPYPPSLNAPASFIASPIYNGDNKIGILVFQLPIDKINNIMTDGYEWAEVGLGETGETYLVGSDFLMRNQSRFLIEDPENFIATLENTTVSRETISKIKALNSTIGLQPINTEGVKRAINGESGVSIFPDYRGVDVLSAYKPLDIQGLNWAIMSEMDKSEAFASIDLMFERFIFWFVILLVIILILSILFARSISNPVRMLTKRASVLAKGNLDDSIKLEQSDEIGILADNFEKMRCSVKKLVVDLQDVNQNLEKKVDDRTKELNRAKEAADAILDKSPVPVAVVDISSARFIRVNEAMTEFNNLSSSEILSRSTLEIYHDQERDRPIVIDKLREYGTVENLELRLKRLGTKEERWGLVSIHPINYLNQDVYIISIIDITERKKSEHELYAANQQIQGIVDSLADALIIINEKGIIEFFSPSAEQLFHYKDKEILGSNIKLLMPSPHKENHHVYMQRYMDTGEAKIIGKEREVDAVRKDGSIFPARLMISEVLTGKKRLFVGLIGDLTERKLAERQLKIQSAAMESAANGIVITNVLGIIQWVNPAFTNLTGYTAEEVIGNNPSVLNAGKHEKEFFKNLWDTILDGKVWHEEVINKKKNGELYYEEMTITPVFDDKGKITQFVAIKQDITERKRLETIVIKAKERMEGELNIAKDIQMSMLPLIFPAYPKRKEIDIYAELIPAREVGGDFYDFYFLDENHICFVVGDVSGKGVPAALMMAVTKTLLKSQAGNDKSTASILTHVNNEIAKDNDTYMFITVFMAILDTNTGELVYSNAGHNPSFIIDLGNKEVKKLGDLHGPVVGAMEGLAYTESKAFINKDDIILAYTDGVTEAQNKNEDLYSDPKFIELLEKVDYDSPKTLTKTIIDSVKAFEDGAEQFDDITVLAAQYCQQPNTVSSAVTSVTIKNKNEEIITAIDQFEAFGMENEISMAIIQKTNIAFDELLNNIISYGYDDDTEHSIQVDVELKSERLVITITDDANPFNPFQNDPPDTKLSAKERDIGGLGIHIVKSLMDEFDYRRSADKNIITLVKYNINA